MPEVTGSSPVGSSTVLFCPGLTLSATLWASLGWQGGTVGEAATLSPGQTSYVGRLKDGKTRGFQLLIFCFPGKGRFPFWLPTGRTRIRRLSLAPRKKEVFLEGLRYKGEVNVAGVWEPGHPESLWIIPDLSPREALSQRISGALCWSGNARGEGMIGIGRPVVGNGVRWFQRPISVLRACGKAIKIVRHTFFPCSAKALETWFRS